MPLDPPHLTISRAIWCGYLDAYGHIGFAQETEPCSHPELFEVLLCWDVLLGLRPWNWAEMLKKDLRDKRGVFFTFVVLQTPRSASWHCNSNVLEYRKKMFTGHWNLLDLFQVALNVLSAIVNCHLCNPLGGHGEILSNSPYLATVAGKDNNVKYIFVSFMCIIYCF
jgi:hypothetical protein